MTFEVWENNTKNPDCVKFVAVKNLTKYRAYKQNFKNKIQKPSNISVPNPVMLTFLKQISKKK